MRLSKRTIETLAQMICGKHGDPYNPTYEWLNFPYRSGSRLYDFFSEDCLLSPIPDFEGARTTWTRDVLTDINNGKVNHWGISSDKLILHVIERLLVSVTRHHELDHQEAINDVNKALAEHGLIVVFVDGKHRIARIVQADSPFGLIGYADVEKLLDDFVSYIKSERRMSFWEWDEDNRKYKWRSKPER
jgi:hypothetical protein